MLPASRLDPDEVVFVVAASHPLAARRFITPAGAMFA
jgi:hypothetical protein